MKHEDNLLVCLITGILSMILVKFFCELDPIDSIIFSVLLLSILLIAIILWWEFLSKYGKNRIKRIDKIKEIPSQLLNKANDSVYVGYDRDLKIPVYLPDNVRTRHVHILGATGSGKTESVILNFIRQDISRGLGCIILDAKGDTTFLHFLNQWADKDKFKIFDLGSETSLSYDPLEVGTPLEAAQRLFSSLTWSEEYYKSKALTALQKIFAKHFETSGKNPTLVDISNYLKTPKHYILAAEGDDYPIKQAENDFAELSSLRDQIKSLCMGHLAKTLSPSNQSEVRLNEVSKGYILYFRLQSLMSPQLVSTIGKLIINHLNYLAGTAHRDNKANAQTQLIPTYLDEFASFACPEFADLISKARSAGMALHFSHQSIGDLTEVSPGFINRITDNSATKIILRINDPDSAEFFSRSFGTALYQKVTQRITNAKEIESAEVLEEGTRREAHQFRASPDLLKTHPTGVGSVLIAHGYETPHGASTVFKINFPNIREEKLA